MLWMLLKQCGGKDIEWSVSKNSQKRPFRYLKKQKKNTPGSYEMNGWGCGAQGISGKHSAKCFLCLGGEGKEVDMFGSCPL